MDNEGFENESVTGGVKYDEENGEETGGEYQLNAEFDKKESEVGKDARETATQKVLDDVEDNEVSKERSSRGKEKQENDHKSPEHETEAKRRKMKDAEANVSANEGDQDGRSPANFKTQEPDENQSEVKLKRELSLVNCVALIVGNMIGSGIFISPRGVLKYSGSVGMSLIIWVGSGFVTMVSALCYAELGTMIPKSGGTYTYLYEAFGPMVAFLQLWMSVTIGIPCSRAIGALTFANYLVQPFFPGCTETPETARKLIAIALIFFLTWVNSRRVKWATTVQEVLALTKVLVLVIIIVAGMHYLAQGHTKRFDNVMENTNWHPALLATTFYHTLWAYAGWDSLNMIMEELKDPFRNMPRAIAISLTCVTTIYVLTNIAYFAVLSPEEILSSEAVAVSFGQRTLSYVAWTIPLFVACSTGGYLNGSVMRDSRFLFVGARRGHLPQVLGLVSVNNYTPITSLVFMASISLIMFVASDLRVLINYISFAGSLINLGTIAAFFWFRIKQPDRPRPIKVWIGFAIFELLMGIFLMVFPAVKQPMEVAFALGVAATGVLVYFLTQHRQITSPRLTKAMDKVTYVCQMLFVAVHEEASKVTEGRADSTKSDTSP